MRNRQRVNNPKEISSRMWMLMFLRTKRSKKNKRFKIKNKKRKKTAKSKFLKKNKKMLQLNKNCSCIMESNVQNVKFHQLLEIDTNAQYVNNLIFVVSANKKMKNMNINQFKLRNLILKNKKNNIQRKRNSKNNQKVLKLEYKKLKRKLGGFLDFSKI